MISFFCQRGYCASSLQRDLDTIQRVNRNDAIKHQDPESRDLSRIPLVLTFHPVTPQNVITIAAKCNTDAKCNNTDAKCNNVFNAKCNNFFNEKCNNAKCNTSLYKKSKYLFKSLSYKAARWVYLKCTQAGLVLRAEGLAI